MLERIAMIVTRGAADALARVERAIRPRLMKPEADEKRRTSGARARENPTPGQRDPTGGE